MKLTDEQLASMEKFFGCDTAMAKFHESPILEHFIYSIQAEMGSWLELKKMALHDGNTERAEAFGSAARGLNQVMVSALQDTILGFPPVFHDSN